MSTETNKPAIRTATLSDATPGTEADPRPRIAPTWEPQADGRVALMFPAGFAQALIAGEMRASSTGKSASPVVLQKPKAPLVVDREDGTEVTYDLTVAVFTKAGQGATVRL